MWVELEGMPEPERDDKLDGEGSSLPFTYISDTDLGTQSHTPFLKYNSLYKLNMRAQSELSPW